MSSFECVENKEPVSSPASDPALSPLRPPTYGQNGRKERRNPSITPKKFSRFFTPRSQLSNGGPARQVFNDITAPSNNRLSILSSPIRSSSRAEKHDAPSTFPRDLKRRKVFHAPKNTPDHVYSESKGNGGFEVLQVEDSDHALQNICSSPCERAVRLGQVREMKDEEEEKDEDEEDLEPLGRIHQVDQRGLGGKLLQSMSGLPARSGRQHYAYPVNGSIFQR